MVNPPGESEVLTIWPLPFSVGSKPREPLMTSHNKPRSEVLGGGNLEGILYNVFASTPY